jgi:neutral ceramidase
MYQAGFSKKDITILVKGTGMMGYGNPQNITLDISTQIYARAIVINNGGELIAFVNAEICFITIALKNKVVEKLKNYKNGIFNDSNIILTAQHTHSAPGGYSHHPFYNFSIPGFSFEVFNKYVDGMVEAIIEAENNQKNVKLYFGSSHFSNEEDVAFNRSTKAYNLNPEVEKVGKDESRFAVNNEMYLIKFVEEQSQKTIASINWFGVHTTSISNDNTTINADNKGYASQFLEQEYAKKNEEHLAIFAQAPCGDISPNYVWDNEKKWTRGKFKDDFESAKHNGKMQFEKALSIINDSENAFEINGEIKSLLIYDDFGKIDVNEEFSNGLKNAKTFPSTHGLAFFQGTVEGPGINNFLATIAKAMIRYAKKNDYKKANANERALLEERDRINGNRDILLESYKGRIMGIEDLNKLPLPSFIDPLIGNMKKHYKAGALKNQPWIPQILPNQLLKLGNVVIAFLPGEITYIAGERMKKMLLEEFSKSGVKKVIIAPYSNAYMGYITTFEEYQAQCYEGGHTCFGQWTHGAFMTNYKKLSTMMLNNENPNEQFPLKPLIIGDDILNLRKFEV